MRIRQLAPDNSTRSNLLRCSTENNYLGGNRRFVVPASCVQSAMCPKAVFSGAFSCVVGRPEHLDQAAQLLEVDVTRAGWHCQVSARLPETHALNGLAASVWGLASKARIRIALADRKGRRSSRHESRTSPKVPTERVQFAGHARGPGRNHFSSGLHCLSENDR